MTFYGVSGGCWQRRRRKKSIECKGPLHGNLGWQNKRGKGYMVLGATWDRFHGIEPIGLRGTGQKTGIVMANRLSSVAL